MSPKGPEGSGPSKFELAQFVVTKAIFELIGQPASTPESRPAALELKIEVGASAQLAADGKGAFVTLQTKVVPDAQWQPYRIEVTVAAAFGSPNSTTEQVLTFCRVAAPSILFPYVREIVHRLTMDAPHGMVRLQPLNIAAMLNETEWKISEADGKVASIVPAVPSEH
jgi:preprotein translocase subunit SecB